jgi:hypothetical protein
MREELETPQNEPKKWWPALAEEVFDAPCIHAVKFNGITDHQTKEADDKIPFQNQQGRDHE